MANATASKKKKVNDSATDSTQEGIIVKSPDAQPSRGLDIGTANIAAASLTYNEETREFEVQSTSLRDVFLAFPAEEQYTLEVSGVPCHLSQDESVAYVIADDAFNMATVMGLSLRRPLANGFVSDKEDQAKEVLNLLLSNLLGKPKVPGELVVFSVPGIPIGGDATTAQFHTRFFSDLLKKSGFTPMPVNEAMAVCLSEVYVPGDIDAIPLTGLCISFGAGMINVALVFKSQLVRSFSLEMGGDFIDHSAAKATNSPVTQVSALKEHGVDVRTGAIVNQLPYHDHQSERQAEAISMMYKELLSKLRDAINTYFGDPKNRLEIHDTLPVIVSGGTAMSIGFKDLFNDIVLHPDHGVEVRFPLAKDATLAKDPLAAVCQGALTLARIRTRTKK